MAEVSKGGTTNTSLSKGQIATLTLRSICIASLSGGLYFAYKKQMGVLGYTAIGAGALIGGVIVGAYAAKAIEPNYFKW